MTTRDIIELICFFLSLLLIIIGNIFYHDEEQRYKKLICLTGALAAISICLGMRIDFMLMR